tara:strand:+ start:1393 stop:2067 length:675 start_codon:yes stop_codon:yes gene_type:complete
MKTYKELSGELDEVMSFKARKALGRRLKQLAKKASTKFKKARNKLKKLPLAMYKKKAQKKVRKFFMQKTAGKGKDISSLPIAQKIRLEKMTDKKFPMGGRKATALVKRFMKKIIKQHRAAAKAAKEAKVDKAKADSAVKKVKEEKTFSQFREDSKRDYKDEYKKFQSSPEKIKYRAELVKYNREKGTYGNGDEKDASHKGGKIVGFEAQSKNRGRAEASRLKKK